MNRVYKYDVGIRNDCFIDLYLTMTFHSKNGQTQKNVFKILVIYRTSPRLLHIIV